MNRLQEEKREKKISSKLPKFQVLMITCLNLVGNCIWVLEFDGEEKGRRMSKGRRREIGPGVGSNEKQQKNLIVWVLIDPICLKLHTSP